MQVVLDDTSQIEGELFSFAATYQHRQHDTMTACAASADPDTMHVLSASNEGTRQSGFYRSHQEEFSDLLNDGVFHFVKLSSVPKQLIPFQQCGPSSKKGDSRPEKFTSGRLV